MTGLISLAFKTLAVLLLLACLTLPGSGAHSNERNICDVVRF
jgi:hypothetical protein